MQEQKTITKDMETQQFVSFNIQFNLRHNNAKKPSIIYAVIAYNKKQYKISTGVKVYPTHWNAKKQVAIIGGGLTNLDNRNNQIANEKIREINYSSEQLKLYLCNSPEDLDTQNFFITLKKYINPNIKPKVKTMAKKILIENATLTMSKTVQNNLNSSETSKAIYNGHISTFKEFLKLKNLQDSWNNINLKTLEEWQQQLIKEERAVGTINLLLSTIKRCCKEIDEVADIWNYNDSKIDRIKKVQLKLNKTDKAKQQIALTEKEIIQIYSYQNLGEKESEIRDIFVLQCLTGQRISDMYKITDGSIQINDKSITISQQKTNENATIPLFDISKILIEKYKKGFKYFDLDNRVHQASLNTGIKIIAEKVGLTAMTTYKKQKGLKIIELKERMCDRIHTHTARHSFITIMCRMGVTKESIIIATGHQDTKMINEVYEHLNDEDKQNKVTSAFANLNSELFAMNTTKEVIIEPQQQESVQQHRHQDTINEAKEVLSMLRVDPSLFYDENDVSSLWRMVTNVEHELLECGIDYKIVKEIFNENKTLRERADILHQIYLEAKAIIKND